MQTSWYKVEGSTTARLGREVTTVDVLEFFCETEFDFTIVGINLWTKLLF